MGRRTYLKCPRYDLLAKQINVIGFLGEANDPYE
jgi:hypothetical protein